MTSLYLLPWIQATSSSTNNGLILLQKSHDLFQSNPILANSLEHRSNLSSLICQVSGPPKPVI